MPQQPTSNLQRRNYSLKLNNFDGVEQDASSFLHRFKIFCDNQKPPLEEKEGLEIFVFHLRYRALTWYYSLSSTVQSSLRLLIQEFVQSYISNRPISALTTELRETKFIIGNDIQVHIAKIIDLGQKLGLSEIQQVYEIEQSLTHGSMKRFIIGANCKNIGEITDRCKIYLSTLQPNETTVTHLHDTEVENNNNKFLEENELLYLNSYNREDNNRRNTFNSNRNFRGRNYFRSRNMNRSRNFSFRGRRNFPQRTFSNERTFGRTNSFNRNRGQFRSNRFRRPYFRGRLARNVTSRSEENLTSRDSVNIQPNKKKEPSRPYGGKYRLNNARKNKEKEENAGYTTDMYDTDFYSSSESIYNPKPEISKYDTNRPIQTNQCTKCLGYGHWRNDCTSVVKCNQCSGDHVTQACQRPLSPRQSSEDTDSKN